MQMNEYQIEAGETAIYPGKKALMGKMYCALKLNGEAGEVAEKIGKVIRDNQSAFQPDKTLEIVKELGDVLWYIAALANEFGFTLEQVAQLNIEKLKKRQQTNKLHGEGDNR